MSGTSSPQHPGSQGSIGLVVRAAVSPRPVWGSRRAYLIATVAGVVGLGAIWRFPYLVGAHGGGSFVLAYLVCMAVIALPLAIIESGAGRLSGVSAVGVFRNVVGEPGRWFGWLSVSVAVLIMSYYYVVTGWTLGYFVDGLRGDTRVFREFSNGYASLGWFLVVGVAVLLVLLRGVEAVEKASRYLLPVLALTLVCLAVYAQTTAGARDAAEYYLTLDLDYLGRGETWRAAAGQAFYQSGIGQGFLIAYASFSPAGLNLARTSLILASANVLVALVAMAMVFPIVFSFGIAPDSGGQLAFTAFPRILNQIEGGPFLAILFFGLLFVAAFTSCLAGTAVPIAAVRDELHLRRRAAATLVVSVVMAIGLFSALSYTPVELSMGGEPILDRVDEFVGSALVIAIGLAGALLLAWLIPIPRLARAIRAGRGRVAGVRLSGATAIWAVRLISPVLLVSFGISTWF